MNIAEWYFNNQNYGLPAFGLEHPKRLIGLCRDLAAAKNSKVLRQLKNSLHRTYTHQALNSDPAAKDQLILVFIAHLCAVENIITEHHTVESDEGIFQEIERLMRSITGIGDWQLQPPFGRAYVLAVKEEIYSGADVQIKSRIVESKFVYVNDDAGEAGGVCRIKLFGTNIEADEIFIHPDDSFRILDADFLRTINLAFSKTAKPGKANAACMKIEQIGFPLYPLTALAGESGGGAMLMGLTALREGYYMPGYIITSFALHPENHKTLSVGGFRNKVAAIENYIHEDKNYCQYYFLVSEEQIYGEEWKQIDRSAIKCKIRTAENSLQAFSTLAKKTIIELYYTDSSVSFLEFAYNNPQRLVQLCHALSIEKNVQTIKELIVALPDVYSHTAINAIEGKEQILLSFSCCLRAAELLIAENGEKLTEEYFEKIRHDMNLFLGIGNWDFPPPLTKDYAAVLLESVREGKSIACSGASSQALFIAINYLSAESGALLRLTVTETEYDYPGLFLHPDNALTELLPDFRKMLNEVYEHSPYARSQNALCIKFEEVKAFEYSLCSLRGESAAGAVMMALMALHKQEKLPDNNIYAFEINYESGELLPIKAFNKKYEIFTKLNAECSVQKPYTLIVSEVQRNDPQWNIIEPLNNNNDVCASSSMDEVYKLIDRVGK